MSRDWIVLDANNLAWRAYHAHKTLEWQGEQTGVVFGVMNDLRHLSERFNSDHFVFCFDLGKGLRESKYPTYKASRRIERLDEEEATRREGVRYQIDKLRNEYLPGLGYKNVFAQKGYEADDLLASVAWEVGGDGDRAVLVTGDEDLYQLLGRDVAVYHPKPKEFVTAKSFKAEYDGLLPEQWPMVKAIAGCPTDDVEGLRGVGEKTAIAWLQNKPLRVKAHDKLIADFLKTPQFRANLEMVTLPYPGCKPIVPEPDDRVGPAAWDELCERLGIKSLAGHRPQYQALDLFNGVE